MTILLQPGARLEFDGEIRRGRPGRREPGSTARFQAPLANRQPDRVPGLREGGLVRGGPCPDPGGAAGRAARRRQPPTFKRTSDIRLMRSGTGSFESVAERRR